MKMSGALEIPDHVASVTTPSLVPAIEQNQNGAQPVKAHKEIGRCGRARSSFPTMRDRESLARLVPSQ